MLHYILLYYTILSYTKKPYYVSGVFQDSDMTFGTPKPRTLGPKPVGLKHRYYWAYKEEGLGNLFGMKP